MAPSGCTLAEPSFTGCTYTQGNPFIQYDSKSVRNYSLELMPLFAILSLWKLSTNLLNTLFTVQNGKLFTFLSNPQLRTNLVEIFLKVPYYLPKKLYGSPKNRMFSPPFTASFLSLNSTCLKGDNNKVATGQSQHLARGVVTIACALCDITER